MQIHALKITTLCWNSFKTTRVTSITTYLGLLVCEKTPPSGQHRKKAVSIAAKIAEKLCKVAYNGEKALLRRLYDFRRE